MTLGGSAETPTHFGASKESLKKVLIICRTNEKAYLANEQTGDGFLGLGVDFHNKTETYIRMNRMKIMSGSAQVET